jgi:hypothetical protein
VPQRPHDLGVPVQAGAAEALELLAVDAKTENFFTSFFEPHFGQAVPLELEERTRISKSFLQSEQVNS